MSLSEYRKKRKFNKTPEPKGTPHLTLSPRSRGAGRNGRGKKGDDSPSPLAIRPRAHLGVEHSVSRHDREVGEGRGEGEKGKLIFIVQEHHARNFHYDFRLEMDGILKSWAVPKCVPEKPGIKHLAVETEDHPLEYADFEGEIPEGEYGAGAVEIWDKGTYEMIEAKEKSYKFTLSGEKIKGTYVLFNFKDNNWLLFKMK